MTSLPQVKSIPMATKTVAFEPMKFFYPTAVAIYKNNDCISQASEILEKKGITHEITMTLPPERSCGNLVCVGRLPYEKLFDYYRGGTLIFPSYIETFGYPMAEARSVGAIVLASDTPFSREVLNGYENAYFFDPFRPEELAALMEQVASGDIAKKETVAPAKQFSGWKTVVEQVRRLGV